MSDKQILSLARNLAIPVLLGAGLVATSMAATADQAQQKTQQPGQTQQSSQTQRGDTVTLTRQEAENWNLRPVSAKDGKEIGQVTALTLNSQGKITELQVSISEELGLGERTVTVKPSQFSTDMNEIVLDVDRDKIKDLPEASK